MTSAALQDPPVAPATEQTLPPASEMSFFDHLRELRKRLIYSLIILAIGATIAYSYSREVFAFLTAPYFEYFPRESLIGTGPAEAFMIKLKTALFAGAILTLPLLFHQVWLFIAPGLYPSERRLVIPFLLITSLLFVAGATLCYQTILPTSFQFFFEQYQSIDVTPQIKLGEQLDLVTMGLLAFGLMFQAPVLTYFLAKLDIITDKTLTSNFRYAVVVIFILAAVLTPTPDVVNQLLFAIPLSVLYGVSILVAKWVGKSNVP